MNVADKYIMILQEVFPNLTVKWNPPPNQIFELNPCVLEFTQKTSPKEVYPIEYHRGFGNNKVEDEIAILISIHGEQLSSL